MAIPSALRPLLRFGTGAAIQIDGPKGAESLQIAAVRVRPNGARLLEHYIVEDFPHQPAGVWGTEYAAFLKKHGIPHVAATVLLPRQDLIVRLLQLPGVNDKDLAGAVQFQLEGLHPYSEDDIVSSWTRLPGTDSVAVTIARRDVVEHYITLFAEAGIMVTSFTGSAAVMYSALRLYHTEPTYKELLAYSPGSNGGVEIYAESPSKPLLSSVFATDLERAAALTSAELRFAEPPQPVSFAALLGAEPALPFAAGLAAACPRLTLPLNLLPEAMRQSSSIMAWVPTAALGLLVVALAGGLMAFPSLAEDRQKRALAEELAKLQPAVTRANNLDRQILDAQKKTLLLDDFRRRAKADMDVLAELTRLLPPPAWVNSLELNERQVTIAGEADQAAPLLRTLDASPLFVATEFSMPPIRIQGGNGRAGGEGFRVRTIREGAAVGGGGK